MTVIDNVGDWITVALSPLKGSQISGKLNKKYKIETSKLTQENHIFDCSAVLVLFDRL